jgi:catechol 2,3-dioxygenase-like lactoylglutathione lyase family enzyme
LGPFTVLDHVSLGVSDLERSRRFYDAALRPLGIVRIIDFGEGRGSDYGAMAGSLGVEFTITVQPNVAPSRGMHLCFRAPNRDAVSAFHSAALMSGGRDDVLTTTPTTLVPLSLIRMGIELKPYAMLLNFPSECEA